jgi:hypothetical protein
MAPLRKALGGIDKVVIRADGGRGVVESWSREAKGTVEVYVPGNAREQELQNAEGFAEEMRNNRYSR